MNQDQMLGNWKVLKAKAQKIWGNTLTEEMIDSAKNNAEELYGVIQRNFGDTKEVIKKKMEDLKM